MLADNDFVARAPENRDIEAPPEDALEQATLADPDDEALSVRVPEELPTEANEADVLEQVYPVNLDEDYR